MQCSLKCQNPHLPSLLCLRMHMDSLYSQGMYGFLFPCSHCSSLMLQSCIYWWCGLHNISIEPWQFLCSVWCFQVQGNAYLFEILLLATNEKLTRKMFLHFSYFSWIFAVKGPISLRSVSKNLTDRWEWRGETNLCHHYRPSPSLSPSLPVSLSLSLTLSLSLSLFCFIENNVNSGALYPPRNSCMGRFSIKWSTCFSHSWVITFLNQIKNLPHAFLVHALVSHLTSIPL